MTESQDCQHDWDLVDSGDDTISDFYECQKCGYTEKLEEGKISQIRKFGLADEEQILVELTRLEIAWIISGLMNTSAMLKAAGVDDDAERAHNLAHTISRTMRS